MLLSKNALALLSQFIVGSVLTGCGPVPAQPLGNVIAERTPNAGIQPQAVVDSTGVLHVVYFRGAPEAGDLFYVRRTPGETTYSAPLRVNSQPGSAIAAGTIRGAHIAIGRQDRVHVAWNGSSTAGPKGPGGTPMLYARLNDLKSGFETQRNLITWAGGIDGGGSVSADAEGTVYVAWHAGPAATDEAHRAVFMARSFDDGRTFECERQVSPRDAGACGCCGMASAVDGSNVYLLFRSAAQNVNRDVTLLASRDRGVSFSATKVHPWNVNACPLTTSTLTLTENGVLAAWETEQQVYVEAFHRSGRSSTVMDPEGSAVMAPEGSAIRRHPAVARNAAGDTLLAWTEGTAWARGGSLSWQVYDASDKPSGAQGHAPGVPAWGLPAAVGRSDGRFLLLY